jgi:hypothetical protein
MTTMPRRQGICGHFLDIFWTLQKKHKYLIFLFPRKKLCIKFDKKWDGLHFGQYFEKLTWSPCSQGLTHE